jgi:DNA-binding PucR family transcriptional regulator
VAVSSICEDSDKLRDREKEARSLLDLADRLDLSEQEVCYDDWKLYGLLLRGGSHEDFSEIAHRHLDPIIRYDLHHDSDLLNTLVAYLNNNLSPSRTSKALFVHLNTVKYRLRRISDLLGSDLGDLHVVLTLQVALMQRDLAPRAFDALIDRNV